MKRVAVYARVSSDRQEREETIASQVEKIRALAAEKQFVILDRHIYLDDGYPGEMLARPGLDRLRDDARDGLLDVVLVHCPDRLARRYAYQVVIVEELEKHSCEVYFVNRPIADTPEDQMLLAMQGVVAEYERAKILERTRRGRLHKARMGILVASGVPYGYRYVPRCGTERGRIEVVAEHAAIVRDIFRWVGEDGLTLYAVARRLREAGIAAPKGGVRWATSTLQALLRNRTYVGELCVNRLMAVEPSTPPKPGVYRRKRKCALRARPPEEWIKIPVRAIVDPPAFAAANDRMAANRRFALRNASPRHPSLLRCLVRCGACGYSMCAVWTESRHGTGAVYRYYICLKHWQWMRYGDGQTRCPAARINGGALDDIVWNDLCHLLSDPQRIAQHAGLEDNPDQSTLRTEAQRLAAEIDACDRQLRRLVDAYQRGAVEVDDLLARRGEIAGRKSLLTDSLKRAETMARDTQVRSALRARLPDLVQRVRQRLEDADFAARQQLVRQLIDRVVVMPDRSVEINYLLRVGTAGDGTHSGPRQGTPCALSEVGVSGESVLRPELPPPARLQPPGAAARQPPQVARGAARRLGAAPGLGARRAALAGGRRRARRI